MKAILHILIFLALIGYLSVMSYGFITGIRVFVVTSNSMQPTLRVGDVLLAKSQEHYNLEDIISFNSDNAVVTHRIVKIQSTVEASMKNFDYTFFTKGDSNEMIDMKPVSSREVIGKIIFILPYIGLVILGLQSRIAGVLFVIILILILFQIVIHKVAQMHKKYLKKGSCV